MIKIKRYHKDVSFPVWAEKSAQTFFEEIAKRHRLYFSSHALGKVLADSVKYGQSYHRFLFQSADVKAFSFDRLFEFYASEETIKKGCLRFSYENFPVDIILVVSADGFVVTSYTINKGDNHSSLNKNLYEKG